MVTCRSIDGTLYLENETPNLIFSHSFEDNPNSGMCMTELKLDLSAADVKGSSAISGFPELMR